MKRPVPRHFVQPSEKRCSMVLYSGAEATGATRTGPVSPLNRLSKLSFSSLVMKVSASPDGSWRSYLTTCPECQHDVDLDVDNPGRWAYPPGSLEAYAILRKLICQTEANACANIGRATSRNGRTITNACRTGNGVRLTSRCPNSRRGCTNRTGSCEPRTQAGVRASRQ